MINLLIPLISTLIGWITNCLAVRMIFRPYKPISFGGFIFQGLVPKRKNEIARKISETVSKHLISHDDFIESISHTKLEEGFREAIDGKLDDFITNKLFAFSPMIAGFIDENLKTKIKDLIVDEIVELLPDISEKITNKIENSFDMKEIIEKRINAFEVEKLETIILAIASKELKSIEILGGVLGFIIGLMQLALLKFL